MANSRSDDVDTQSAAARFFSAKQFAVAGASSDPSKFGHRIFAWYLHHKLPAIPLNPACSHVKVRGREYETVAYPAGLPDPNNTALSVVTPPPVTAKLLREAKDSGIPAVWLQPGSFTHHELNWAIEHFPGGAVGGYAEGTVGGEGWCVLVDGAAAIRAVQRSSTGDAPKPTAKRQVGKGDRFHLSLL